MTPYYSEDGITIYHGDCLEVMPGLAAECVFADPPYNVGQWVKWSYLSHDDAMAPTAYKEWCIEWFKLARSVSSHSVVITPGILNLPLWIAEIEPTHKVIAWSKPAANNWNYLGKTSGFNVWEPVLVYGKSPVNVPRDHVEFNISRQPGLDDHPCPKPIGLMRWIVQSFTTTEGTILDPFMGSGSTLRAAKDLGRKAIGIEISEPYCEIAAQRLGQGVLAFGE